MKSIVILLLASILSTSFAGDHGLTPITGKGIKLSSQGHAIAGSIGNLLVFGVVTGESHDASSLIIHNDGEVYGAQFENENGHWGGVINDQNKKSVIKFVSYDPEDYTYTVSYNGKEFLVKVGFEKYEDNHFINPTYTMNFYGKTLSVKMKEGRACKKYSLHLIFMIFGTFLHSL